MVHSVDQILHVLELGAHIIEITLVVGVGGADVDCPVTRNGENHAAVRHIEVDGVMDGKAFAGDDNMHAFCGSQAFA